MNDKIKKAFTETYMKNKWGKKGQESGQGSTPPYTSNIRMELKNIINSKKVKTILDCSCGDWNWMKEIDLSDTVYVGVDVVSELIEKNHRKYSTENIQFINNDCLSYLKKSKNNSFDLIICRHTLEHLKTQYCLEVCKEIKRVGKYALITSNNSKGENINSDIDFTGENGRQIDLEEPPFFDILGFPIKKIRDTKGAESEKSEKFNGINLYYLLEKE